MSQWHNLSSKSSGTDTDIGRPDSLPTSFGELNSNIMSNPSITQDFEGHSQHVESLWSTGVYMSRWKLRKIILLALDVSTVLDPNGWNMGDPSPSMQTNDEPIIVKSVDINVNLNSYAGAAGAATKDHTNVQSNFHSLVADKVFDGFNIFIPRKVVEKAKYELKRIMMNDKGFFLFKFDSLAGLNAILEGGPWMVRNSPIILKK
nr:hypothetical protein [Tanacetum cinerariifolium]